MTYHIVITEQTVSAFFNCRGPMDYDGILEVIFETAGNEDPISLGRFSFSGHTDLMNDERHYFAETFTSPITFDFTPDDPWVTGVVKVRSAFTVTNGCYSFCYDESYTTLSAQGMIDMTWTLSPNEQEFRFSRNPGGARLNCGDFWGLHAAVEACGPVEFQWFKDGRPLAGGTSDSYGIGYASELDAGLYWVTAKQGNREIRSSTASISVSACSASIYGFVRDKYGAVSGARVATGFEETMTDDNGQYLLRNIDPGPQSISVIKDGYYPATVATTVARGEHKSLHVTLTLVPSPDDPPDRIFAPLVFSFSPDGGLHLIPGLPSSISFTAFVFWNGSPGSVQFLYPGGSEPATLSPFDATSVKASFVLPSPMAIAECGELIVKAVNGEGYVRHFNTGVFLHPEDGILDAWYDNHLPWQTASDGSFSFGDSLGGSLEVPDWRRGQLKLKAEIARARQLTFSSREGKYAGTLSASGSLQFEADLPDEISGITVEGDVGVEFGAGLELEYEDCFAQAARSWSVSFSGRTGFTGPAVVVLPAFFPPLLQPINALEKFPAFNRLKDKFRIGISVPFGMEVSGNYRPGQSSGCFLGTSSLDISGAVGIEGQGSVAFGKANVNLTIGGTATPQFQFCPDTLTMESLKVRGYAKITAELYNLSYSGDFSTEYEFERNGQALAFSLAQLAEMPLQLSWRPIGDDRLIWGPANEPAYGSQVMDGPRYTECLLRNVASVSRPALLVNAGESLIAFSQHNPEMPAFAAEDIILALRNTSFDWTSGALSADPASEFDPKLATTTDGLVATWERVGGQSGSITNPADIYTRMEIVAAHFDRFSGTWSAAALTDNGAVDRDPLPLAFGSVSGVLWIANEANAVPGNVLHGDRLMFAMWNGSGWEPSQVLWSEPHGIVSIADNTGGAEAQLVFAVDLDGDTETSADRELYYMETFAGQWLAPIRLTDDAVEDAIPALVAPNGQTMCVWNRGSTLTYSSVAPWNPRPVYAGRTAATEASSIRAVTITEGAIVAYTAPGTNGVDVVASFYDADLDLWSWPRKLTDDADTEKSISLAYDGNAVQFAYLKTQMLRTNAHIPAGNHEGASPNALSPGQTDLYLTRYSQGVDLAIVPGSLKVEPQNPAPGSAAIIRLVVENRGELPAMNIPITFYDYSRQAYYAIPGVTIAGPLVGGATQEVAVAWYVPEERSFHWITTYIDTDSATPKIPDRDAANNLSTLATVLPDLVLSSISSITLSDSRVALLATVRNAGVVPASSVVVEWRARGSDGEILGTAAIDVIAPGQEQEVSCLWDINGLELGNLIPSVTASADPQNTIAESDENNNERSSSVRIRPSWVPRITLLEKVVGVDRIHFQAANSFRTDFTLESSGSLNPEAQWQSESGAVFLNQDGRSFYVDVPATDKSRFYRIRAQSGRP